MKRTKLFFVPADDRILVLEADEKAVKQMEAGVDLDTILFNGTAVGHAIVVTMENGKVTSIAI